jgi:hypothetical protein
MEARRLEPGDEAGLKALRRGWLLSSEAFRQQMLEQAEGKVGEHHCEGVTQSLVRCDEPMVTGGSVRFRDSLWGQPWPNGDSDQEQEQEQVQELPRSG